MLGKRKFGMFLNTKYIGIKEGIKKAKELNLDNVQLYALNEEFNLCELSNQEFYNIKDYLFNKGINITSLAISFGHNGILSENKETIFNLYHDISEIGMELGTNIITAHIGPIPSDNNCDLYKKMKDLCYHICSICENNNSFFAIETGSEKAIVLRGFLDDINSKHLAINFDPANIISGVNENPIESINLLKGYIIQTHIKDCRKINGQGFISYEETAAGNGEVNFDLLFNHLDQTMFNGFHIIERNDYFDKNNGIEQSVKFLSKYF